MGPPHLQGDTLRRRVELKAGLSNEIFPEIEQTILRELLSEAQKGLRDLDLEIALAQSVLNGLQMQREKDTERVNRFHVAMAPHKKIPSEILVKIFVYYLDRRPVYVPIRRSSPLWVLSNVCSRWRRIAFNEPRLWNRICSSIADERDSTVLHEALSRSGKSSILLDLSGGKYHANDDTGQLTRDFLLSYHDRIRDLVLPLPNPCPTSRLQFPPNSFTLLTSLKLDFLDNPLKNLDSDSAAVLAFKNTPYLRRVELCSEPRRSFETTGFNFTSFPWVQLTEIVFSGLTILGVDIITLLRQCKSVVTCSFVVGDAPSLSFYPADPISVPTLRSLTICPCRFQFDQFLKSLVLPSLKIFEIKGGEFRWPYGAFIDLLNRSHTHLRSFRCGYMMPASDLRCLLRAIPTVTEFQVDPKYIIDDTTIRLMLGGEILPNLERVNFWVSSIDLTLDLVESRWTKVEEGKYFGIRKATIRGDTDDMISWDRFKRLEPKFLEDGRDIQLVLPLVS